MALCHVLLLNYSLCAPRIVLSSTASLQLSFTQDNSSLCVVFTVHHPLN